MTDRPASPSPILDKVRPTARAGLCLAGEPDRTAGGPGEEGRGRGATALLGRRAGPRQRPQPKPGLAWVAQARAGMAETSWGARKRKEIEPETISLAAG